MRTNRRRFLQAATLAAGSVAAAGGETESRATRSDAPAGSPSVPDKIRALKPMTAGVVPISDDERKQRIDKARRLMAEHRMDAIFMEGTTSCYYYTGMRWFQSERTFGVVIPASGSLAYVCPAFEEGTARELNKPAFGDEVRVWQEDDSPYALIAGIVKDRGIKHRRIGVEERVRFFVAEGIRKAAVGMDIVEATPVTAGCRMFKSKAEIALMQRANDVTIAAYKAGLATMREGMTREKLERNLSAAFAALGFPGSATVQFGKWTALPHGSSAPQTLREGDVVMIDDGAECGGGEFGIRLEDDVYIGEDGPHFFSKQSVSIDQPFG